DANAYLLLKDASYARYAPCSLWLHSASDGENHGSRSYSHHRCDDDVVACRVSQQRPQPTKLAQEPNYRKLGARPFGARASKWQQGPIVWHQSEGHRCVRRQGPFLSHVCAPRPSENRVKCSNDREP